MSLYPDRPWRHLYQRKEWIEGRKTFLEEHPLCEWHLKRQPQRYVPATIVHHSTPHKGNEIIFFDRTKWVALCKRCHDSDAQRQEKSGHTHTIIGEDGWPIS